MQTTLDYRSFIVSLAVLDREPSLKIKMAAKIQNGCQDGRQKSSILRYPSHNLQYFAK
jgi:hypothetical protein